jgi:hypothetical protein
MINIDLVNISRKIRKEGRLIPGRYFHIVFSVPHLLNPLFYINQNLCCKLLFDAASQALQNAGRNPQFLGAETGAVAVLCKLCPE